MRALPPASQKSAAVFGRVQLSAAAIQQGQAGAMSIEGSLQLANTGKLGHGSLAAASVGMAATWEALQMCPPNTADSLQFMTVGVQNGSIHSNHRLHAAHGSAAMWGVVTKPVYLQPGSSMGATAVPVVTPQTALLPVDSIASSRTDTPADAAQQAVTNAEQLQADQPVIHSKLLAMGVHERKMFIQAQVCWSGCYTYATTVSSAICTVLFNLH